MDTVSYYNKYYYPNGISDLYIITWLVLPRATNFINMFTVPVSISLVSVIIFLLTDNNIVSPFMSYIKLNSLVSLQYSNNTVLQGNFMNGQRKRRIFA